MQGPDSGHTWLGVGVDELPVAEAYQWAVRPECGAVVLFSGTVRDHSVDDDGTRREGVTLLTYEAYEEQVVPRLGDIADEVRRRWPSTGRIVLLHRLGPLQLGDSSVLVVVSAAHRGAAFEAGRYAIDALKASAPIWKHEQWTEGSDWGTRAHRPVAAADVPGAST